MMNPWDTASQKRKEKGRSTGMGEDGELTDTRI